MDQKCIEKFRDGGIDINDGLNRFAGSTELYEKFLRKFKDDKTFEDLGKAVEARNCDEAFKAAHALKGVSGNLSMICVYKITSDMCAAFRANEPEKAFGMYPDLKNKYETVCKLIDELN
jgi:HPt (histidine-containing phosphotransfer) domain-containing protein